MAEQKTTLPRPNATVLSIADLVLAATAGRVRIPPFQRRFRWEARDIERLFDSVWRGYPIGSLLFWQRSAPAAAIELGPVHVDADDEPDALWVVDGQQRVTTLVGALAAPDDVRGHFDLYFDLQQATFRRPGQRRPPAHWLPLRYVVDTNRLLRWLLDFQASGGSEDSVDLATSLGKVIREYQVPVSIVQTEDEALLRDIFDRLNTFGRRLTRAEVFQALHAAIGEQRPTDLRALVDEVAELGFGDLREDTVLRSVLALRGGDPFRDFHDEFKPGEDPADAYRGTADALRRVVTFLTGEAFIPHVRVLPYVLVVPVLARFFDLHADPADRSRLLLRRWLWRGALAGIGGGAGATAILRRAVQAVDSDEHASVQRLLGLVKAPIEQLDLGAIQLNRAAARVNYALLAALGPRDLRSGEPVDVASRFDQEDSAEALLRVTPSGHRIESLANIFIHEGIRDDEFSSAVLGASTEILDSHAISSDAVDALRAGDMGGFFLVRRSQLAESLEARRNVLAEPGANDRPAIEALIVADVDAS